MLPKPREEVTPALVTHQPSRRIALVGIPELRVASITAALGAAGVTSESISAASLSAEINRFDGAIYALGSPDSGSAGSDQEIFRRRLPIPVLVIGNGDHLLAGMDDVFRWADELLTEPWSDASLVLAVSRLISRSPTPARSATVSPTAPTGPLILIADDDTSQVNLLRAVLGRRGMEISAVSDGPAAISLIRQRLPDAVLLDVNMPVMNGLTVLAKIRLDFGLVKLPIALLTSYSDSARVSEALRLGADDYIVKPFQHAELTRRVTRLLSLGRTN
jgi:CheY-like chemotaxis protein